MKYHHLTEGERYQIQALNAEGFGPSAIGQRDSAGEAEGGGGSSSKGGGDKVQHSKIHRAITKNFMWLFLKAWQIALWYFMFLLIAA